MSVLSDVSSIHVPYQRLMPILHYTKETRTCRMVTMIVLVAMSTVIQLSIGIYGNSLTLLANAFDQISDLIALSIGLASIKMGKRKATSNLTFGYKRAELIGAFINACFPLSTALFVLTQAVEQFLEPNPIKSVNLTLFAAATGIAVNFVGMFLFSEGEGHSDAEKAAMIEEADRDELDEHLHTPQQHKKKKDVAMRGVFLHVLSDFCGSLLAFLSAMLKKYLPEWEYIEYCDPVCSLGMAALLVNAAVPLLKTVVKTLMMQSCVPKESLIREIMEVEGVAGVHELHTWQYVANIEIAHVHVVVRGDESGSLQFKDYNHISMHVTEVFHRNGIHSTTVQLEIVPTSEPDVDCCFGAAICGNHAAQCCGHLDHKVLPSSHLGEMKGHAACQMPLEQMVGIIFEERARK